MRRPPITRPLFACAAILALMLAACGGSSNKSNGGGGATGKPTAGKQGGDLTVLYAGDVDYLDPGAAYYQYSNNVMYATQRPLYSLQARRSAEARARPGAGPPQVSDGGKTVTVKIRSGVKFSPPVNRAVTSKDVKYAFERAFTLQRGQRLRRRLLRRPGRAKKNPKPGTDIPGIQTPDDNTIVFKLTRPSAGIVAAGLVMPISAPVPREYALPFDSKTTSQYAQAHRLHRALHGQERRPGQRHRLEARRGCSSWCATPTGTRPPTASRPTWTRSRSRRATATRRSRAATSSTPRAPCRATSRSRPTCSSQVVQGSQKSQLVVSPPTGRVRYIALDTKIKPFDNINVRKAISAAVDRNAMRLAFGGPLVGLIPTHFISPGLPGYDAAGGPTGPGVDFLKNPSGDMKLAAEYMKKAGYPSGKYTGTQRFLMVSDNANNQLKAAQVALNNIPGAGLQGQLPVRRARHDVHEVLPGAQAEGGDLPERRLAEGLRRRPDGARPDVQRQEHPADQQRQLAAARRPAINKAMNQAETVVPPPQRAQKWGEIDKMVTATAAAIPWLWDKQPNLESKNVNGVINSANATWDFLYTSLK